MLGLGLAKGVNLRTSPYAASSPAPPSAEFMSLHCIAIKGPALR